MPRRNLAVAQRLSIDAAAGRGADLGQRHQARPSRSALIREPRSRSIYLVRMI
jgi:hypothetical protein